MSEAKIITLCPKHRRYLDWSECSEGHSDTCSIALARKLKESGEATRSKTVIIPRHIQAKKVSRQRKLQLAYKEIGRCVTCGSEDVFGKTYCLYHQIMSRERQRKYKGNKKRYTNANSYKKEMEIRNAKSGRKQSGHSY